MKHLLLLTALVCAIAAQNASSDDKGVIDQVAAQAATATEKLGDGLSNASDQINEAAEKATNEANDAGKAVQGTSEKVEEKTSEIGKEIEEVVTDNSETAVEAVDTAIGKEQNTAADTSKSLNEIANEATDQAEEKMDEVVESAGIAAEEATNDVSDKIQTAVESAGIAAEEATSDASDKIQTAVESTGIAAEEATNDVSDKIQTAVESAGTAAEEATNDASDKIQTAGEKMIPAAFDKSSEDGGESRTGKAENPKCLAPMKPGRCMAYIERYYYNVNKRRCEMFVYGGCGANSNNFETLAECVGTCTFMTTVAPVTEKPDCLAPMKPGQCRAYIERYYYNVNKRQCEMFVYGGCGANGNNFDTLAKCEDTCTIMTTAEETTVAPMTEEPDVTTQVTEEPDVTTQVTDTAEPTTLKTRRGPTDPDDWMKTKCIGDRVELMWIIYTGNRQFNFRVTSATLNKYSFKKDLEQRLFENNGANGINMETNDTAIKVNISNSQNGQSENMAFKATIDPVEMRHGGYYGMQLQLMDMDTGMKYQTEAFPQNSWTLNINFDQRYNTSLSVCNEHGNCVTSYKPFVSVSRFEFGNIWPNSMVTTKCRRPKVSTDDEVIVSFKGRFQKTSTVGDEEWWETSAADIFTAFKTTTGGTHPHLDFNCTLEFPPASLCANQRTRTIRVRSDAGNLMAEWSIFYIIIAGFIGKACNILKA